MGKRRHHDKEEYIERKIRKLEKKKSRLRKKHRHRDYNDSSASPRSETEHYISDYLEPDPLQEDSPNEEAPQDDIIIDLVEPVPAAPAPPLAAEPAPVVAVVTDAPLPSADAAPPPPAELQPDILCILGDEPEKEENFGPCIQKDIACRWSDILINGLKDETKIGILNSYEVPENLKLVQAPSLNAEIKAAINENVLKRDSILVEKQKLLASVITGIAGTMSSLLSADSKEEVDKTRFLKSLSDAGRLLCHIHYSETVTRRNFLLTTLNKEVKDNIKDLKRDYLLFGKDLQENLKSMKAITKTGAELKQAVSKPKPQLLRNKQPGPSTSKALNWRGGPASAPPPPPRRAPARQTSTSGGRRPPPPRRTADHRAPARHHGRPARR